MRDKIRECLGDSMIMKRVINPYRYSKREVTCFYSLDFLDEDSEHLVPGGLAIGFMGIDSKHPEKELEHILCLIPEHLLGRLILREQYQGLADIARHVLPLTVTLIYIFTGDVPVPSEFVILLASGYYAMKRDDGTSIPVAKTWIPRSRYTPEQDAKLGQISAALGNDALVIDSPTFNKAHYIDPIALERPRLLGVDSFVEKIPDVVGLSRTRRY